MIFIIIITLFTVPAALGMITVWYYLSEILFVWWLYKLYRSLITLAFDVKLLSSMLGIILLQELDFYLPDLSLPWLLSPLLGFYLDWILRNIELNQSPLDNWLKKLIIGIMIEIIPIIPIVLFKMDRFQSILYGLIKLSMSV